MPTNLQKHLRPLEYSIFRSYGSEIKCSEKQKKRPETPNILQRKGRKEKKKKK